MIFDLDPLQRKAALEKTFERLEYYYEHTEEFRASPALDKEEIMGFVGATNLEKGLDHGEALDHVMDGLERYQVHTPHPMYYGLFNPRPTFAGILGDLITASYNPQLAAWSHSPFGNEVEARLVREFATRFGYDPGSADGVFSGGGNESNLSALACALVHRHPDFPQKGAMALTRRPIVFCSEEAHHSVQKSARVVGLGMDSVRCIPVREDLKMDCEILEQEIRKLEGTDAEALMIIGTAGTTGTGTVDELEKLAALAREHGLWYHVDAAYGGACALSRKLAGELRGIGLSDSLTFDAHKWMSVPMAGSLFLTSHSGILERTFGIATEYMPKEASKMEITDPFNHSIQWSRRFIGLKVYLSLLFYGWEGYERVIDHQAAMGEVLRRKLEEQGWKVLNPTVLPVVCFVHPEHEEDPDFARGILDRVLGEGKAWLSIYPVRGVQAFRACITNYNTGEKDLDALLKMVLA